MLYDDLDSKVRVKKKILVTEDKTHRTKCFSNVIVIYRSAGKTVTFKRENMLLTYIQVNTLLYILQTSVMINELCQHFHIFQESRQKLLGDLHVHTI